MPDLHPLVIHFPIAFLMFYAIFEFIRFKKLREQPLLFQIKTIFVTIGAIGGIVAAQFGELAEKNYRNDGASETLRIIQMHSTFATITNILAIVVAGLYIFAWIHKAGILSKYSWSKKINPALVRAEQITHSWIMMILAAGIFLLISVTGALGGSIVYGENADPFAALIYKIFIR